MNQAEHKIWLQSEPTKKLLMTLTERRGGYKQDICAITDTGDNLCKNYYRLQGQHDEVADIIEMMLEGEKDE